MNNLVSKSPILRFKLGRKIIKAEDGWRLINGKATKLDMNPNVKQSSNFLNAPSLTLRYIVNGKQYGSFDGGKTYYGLSEGGHPLSYKANQQILTAIGRKNKPEVIDNSKGAGSIGSTRGTRAFYQFGKMGGWNRSMGSSIDQDSLNMIKEMGIEGKSAQDIQNEINKVFGSNAVKVDNKWGNLSRAGLKAYYDRWKAELVEPSLTITPPSLSPEFKLLLNQEAALENSSPYNVIANNTNLEVNPNRYVSVGPYNNQKGSTALKDYGVRDYNSLINYIKNNPNSFLSLDLTHLFGNVDNWNQQDFENTVGIRGHYGRLNRNSLWGYLAGLQNKWNNASYKKGGLISRNPILRFKSNFR